MKFYEILNEQRGKIAPGGLRIGGGRVGYNAPMFIYKIVFKKEPPFIPGRAGSHPEKNWRGIMIDKKVPTKAMNKIADISGIETRASCQGSDKNKPTFVIIRFSHDNEKKIKQFCSKMNKFKDVRCGYDIGREGRPRIGIASPNLWYSKEKKEKFLNWWNALPNKIKSSV